MSIQERIIITKEEEEARLRREKKIWGVFPRLKSNKSSSSGKSTPTLPPSFGGVVSVSKDKNAAHEEYDEDDEDDVRHARPSTSSGAATPTHLNVPHPLNGLAGKSGGGG